ncbi:ABC transporter permease subunit [Jiella pacifica]|uniref:ABC transporter permease n=1 Tax=Jiella pacifica TaxID=2696469 RepID=A0A6N9TAS9_9HYPH|nr:ABC transporter permease [Jiella pacifica]NDW07325.1 ABC transporter permease [Jiella pacifica]
MTATITTSRELARSLARSQGLLVALATLAAVFILLQANLASGFSYYDVSSTFASTATLAIAAIGATIVVISRGLDLSVGSVISLSNCLIAVNMGDSLGSMVLWALLGIAAGALVGLFNGIFVAVFRLPSIIVTLASMFIVEGITLMILDQPGGMVPASFSGFFLSDAVSGLLPMPAVLVVVVLFGWFALKASPFGTNLYAIGSSDEAALAKGVRVDLTRLIAYVIAGAVYGLAGMFLTAQTGSGDPTVGPPMLLPVFVAVVLGGTPFTGGRGGCLGAVFGALTLMLVVNLLLVFNVPTFYATVVEGCLLILAVLAGSRERIVEAVAGLRLWFRRRSKSAKPHVRRRHDDLPLPRPDDSLPSNAVLRWMTRHRRALRSSLPVYVSLLVVLAATLTLFEGRLSGASYFNSLFVLTTFLAVLALGQGSVVIGGGLDLSVPAMITFSGVMLGEWTIGGMGGFAPLAVIALAAVIGAASGFGIGVIGVHPLIMTLAVDGILAGVTLVATGGTPRGAAPAWISWLMTGKIAGLTPVVPALLVFVAGASLLLARTPFARRLYAVGSNPVMAYFSGVSIARTQIAAYALSAACAALVGILLTGFSGQAFIDMGTPYLLPSIAVVVIGGTAMTGGRGTYLGMFGGALLMTALSMALQGMLIPIAVRNVIFGAVILGAVIGLREK